MSQTPGVRAVPASGTAAVPESYATSATTTGFALAFPGSAELRLETATNCWMAFGGLEFDLQLDASAPDDTRLLVILIDADHHWHQKELPARAAVGAPARFRIGMHAGADGWEPRGHFGVWNHRVRMLPQKVGLRLFSEQPYTGVAAIDNVTFFPAAVIDKAPEIGRIRVLTPEAAVFELYELEVDLPDRYDNPFDPDEVVLRAQVEQPDGSIKTIQGFYYQPFYRQRSSRRDRLVPQGSPRWRVRYTPVTPGLHRMELEVEDKYGAAGSQPIEFTAGAPCNPGFVRVSENDPRFFEFDDGSPFFPIGHNLRSPFDERMHAQFPWAIRHDQGSKSYERYFREMQASGQNATEIWMASWSLGIEWSRDSPGYRGLGQYNLIHAWELDRVIEQAARHGVYVNLTIHNHGKFSTHWDQEWDANPYNRKIGGYLQTPEDYFTDERAMRDFEQLMQYIIARWGYSTHVYVWKLWNELDLTGSRRERVNHLRPEVVEWHRRMGRRIKEMDPYRRLIGTHFCGDFTHQNAEIVRLPEIDLAMIDAYHSNPNPLHIVDLMLRSAAFNNRFDKPVLITEFGGSPHAATLQHLEAALHAGLWSSVAIPLGGAPMLWWWELIAEQNYYDKYRALANFMHDENRRSPDAGTRRIPTSGGGSSNYQALFFSDGHTGLGWLADVSNFTSANPPVVKDLVIRLDEMRPGRYRVEFWETRGGTPVHTEQVVSDTGSFGLAVPEFTRDLAFKIRSIDPGADP